MEVHRSVLLPLMDDQTDVASSSECHEGTEHSQVNHAEYIWQVRDPRSGKAERELHV